MVLALGRMRSVLVMVLAACLLLAGCGGQTSTSDAVGTDQASTQAHDSSGAAASGSSEAEGVSAAIRYLGQASVRIVTREGKVIYIDPYAGSDEDYGLPADLVLVTHDHFDHTAVERVALRNEGCRVITQDEAIVDGRHQTFELGYATVVSVQAGFNALHDVRSCVGYVIRLSDGVSVYVTGDTSTTDDMRDGTLRDLGIDYAFWCCDGVYNMGPDEAAAAARMVGAAHNIAYHNTTSDTGERYDRDAAERFPAPNLLVLPPGHEIAL